MMSDISAGSLLAVVIVGSAGLIVAWLAVDLFRTGAGDRSLDTPPTMWSASDDDTHHHGGLADHAGDGGGHGGDAGGDGDGEH